jgi:hypothetical protein
MKKKGFTLLLVHIFEPGVQMCFKRIFFFSNHAQQAFLLSKQSKACEKYPGLSSGNAILFFLPHALLFLKITISGGPCDHARFSQWSAILKTRVHIDMYDIALGPWQL